VVTTSGSSSIGIGGTSDSIIKVDVTVLVPSRVVTVWVPAMLGGAVKFAEKFPCQHDQAKSGS